MLNVYLTLTRVVFESVFTAARVSSTANLTLTRVVFEFKFKFGI